MIFPLVVGLGSHCGDDQAGWIILDRLRVLGYPSDHLRQAQHPAEILDVIGADRDLLVCDACESSSPTAAVHCWTWPLKGLETRRHRGTHDMGLDQVLQLAAQLKQCPAKVEIWAVEGQNWSAASSPDVAVFDAAQQAAKAIWSRYAHA